jgi:hypothetical protein
MQAQAVVWGAGAAPTWRARRRDRELLLWVPVTARFSTMPIDEIPV